MASSEASAALTAQDNEHPASAEHPVAHDVQIELGQVLPVWTIVPFILILLAIAIVPLAAHHWWESNANKALIAAACAVPIFAYLLSMGHVGHEVIAEVFHEYYAFIVLLVSLFTISGGIFLDGDLRATPRTNAAFIAIGALLASFVGTTGAAMLLIRPLIKTNSQRRHKTHIFVFFIFLVANIGGSLLPVGDPPLFLGFLYGVPFFWTLTAMWPMWLLANGILLAVFYAWDSIAYRRESQVDLNRDAEQTQPLTVTGKLNLLLLLGVLAAVVFLKDYPAHDGPGLALAWMQQPAMLLLALVSYAIDHRAKQRATGRGDSSFLTPRERNAFNFDPMIEVAVLFIGIFITMVPAICLLKANGASLGVTQPWQFFWMTGSLSSFLDNAPTYATFFALGQGTTSEMLMANPELAVVQANSGPVASQILLAISVGAVFMGAMTYIGNAPNFMVKSICESSGIKMPSFFGYMAYSCGILLPVFALITFIFFV
ncbi:MAG: sodium:proton antiporter [Myxococcota bacterium]|nr:sodium:proton antiporter [Myxococcota bacterium]